MTRRELGSSRWRSLVAAVAIGLVTACQPGTVRSRAAQIDEGITGESLFQIIDGVQTGKGPRAAWRTWLADKLFPVQGPPGPPPGPTPAALAGAAKPKAAKAVAPTPAKNVKGLSVVDTLFWMHSTYRATLDKSGARVAPSAIGSRGTVAAHGFLNLDPAIVAALSGSDGGGLKWLGGVQGGTKDFMHFQLAAPPKIERAGGTEAP
jgi:hypothetical protein